MKIRFLGTGAADWDISKPLTIKNFRRFSAAVIDDCLLIDPGPCVYEFSDTFGYPLDNIKYVINTHRHGDHYSEDTVNRLVAAGAEFLELKSGDTVNIGCYSISAYAANHSTCADAVHFIISSTTDGKSIFYGLDGAWLLYDEVAAIKKLKPDIAVLDATIGDINGDYRIFEHNNLRMILEMQKSLSPFIKTFIISHMARTLHDRHEILEKRMSEYGIITAYDNLEFIF